MENDQERRLINLRVLAKLAPGDCLRTKGRLLQIEPRENLWILRAMSRWWNGESRNQMTDDITLLIRQCFSDLKNSNLSEHQKHRITISLIDALSGIKELIKLYRTDAVTSSRLEILSIDIEELSKKYNLENDTDED